MGALGDGLEVVPRLSGGKGQFIGDSNQRQKSATAPMAARQPDIYPNA